MREGGAFLECLKRKSSGMWGKEFLRRVAMLSRRAFSNLWEFGTPLLSCPPSSRSVSNSAPPVLESLRRGCFVRSMDGTFMMRPSSSSSAAEGEALCSPSSLPRRNATRLYRKWFLKEGKTEGGHFGQRDGVGYRESHLQTNKILGREERDEGWGVSIPLESHEQWHLIV